MQSRKHIIEKIKEEQNDLSNVIKKLGLFIRTSNDFKKLDPALKSLLIKQYKTMDDYYELLDIRKQYLNGSIDPHIVENLRIAYNNLYKSMFGKANVK